MKNHNGKSIVAVHSPPKARAKSKLPPFVKGTEHYIPMKLRKAFIINKIAAAMTPQAKKKLT